ncbi:UNVERIFIED_CONTAM: hypothetical protein FKN15_070099 [Acipenser sinensis]
MSQRYKVIQRADSINRVKTSCENSTDYAGFLLEQERKCGPDGFLDSKRYRNPYLVRERLVKKLQTNRDASLSRPQQKVDLSSQKEYDLKEHEHGIQCIEKLVCRAAEIEHKLSNEVHRSEYEWKKQKNQVDYLQAQLCRLRIQNSNQIQRGMAEALRKEEELLWLLSKEKSELHKKLVFRAAEIEHKLSNEVHRSEYEWKKQKNQVDDLQAQLCRLRMQNSNQVRGNS